MNPNAVIGRWARTLWGPFLTVWVLITLAAPGEDTLAALARLGGFEGRFDDTWWTVMLLGSFWAAGVAICLFAVDVLLLRNKWRRLPCGFRGWLGGVGAPAAVVLWAQLMPSTESVPRAVLQIVACFWLGALSVRLLFGRRPS